MSWIEVLRAVRGDKVVVTVACAEGSTPREAGAKMIVAADRTIGTVGGGHLELKAIERARAMLADAAGGAVSFERFALGPSLGQCCGGAVTLVLERVADAPGEWLDELARRRGGGDVLVLATGITADRRLIARRDAGCVAGVDGAPAELRDAARALIEDPTQAACLLKDRAGQPVLLERIAPEGFHVMLFGAGHVGQAIARLLGTLPCRVTWVDERAAQFPPGVAPNVAVEWSDAPALEVAEAPPATFYLVMTHSHALDQDICERVLARGDFAYLGLIGSGTKRVTFERRLAARGIAPAMLARMTCPIGIEGLKSKEPAVIAVSVAAQLLRIREQQLTQAAAPSPAHQ